MLMINADSSSAALHDMLLQACCVNEVYDRQCEDSRATYLHRLITASGAQDFFFETLLNKLNSATGSLQAGLKEDHLGWAQIFAILCLMAAKNEHFVRDDLYEFFDKSPQDLAELCLWPLVRLDGMGGLLRCVRRIHNEILADYDHNGWIFESLVEELVERDGGEAAAIELQMARREVVELDRLISLKDAARPEATTREFVDYEAFKRRLDATGTAWGGRNFTEVELLAAANDLVNEHESSRLRSYLNIFRTRHFPLSAAKLLPLMDHHDKRVAWRATYALANLHDDQVREAAFSALRQGRLAQAVRLLKSNYRAGDIAVIETELKNATLDDDAVHALGSVVLNLAENDPVAAADASGVLIWLYASGRCSICRRSVVKLLAEADAVPDWMAQEIPFDVNTDLAIFLGQNS